MMMSRDTDHAPGRVAETMLNRLLFAASFAGGVEPAAVMCAINDGLVDRRDAARVRVMLGHVSRLRRAYDGLDDDARARLGGTRYERRSAFARGVLASAEVPS